MIRKPAINEMKTLPAYTLNELRGRIKLTNAELKEWEKFKEKVLFRINRLEVKHANKKIQIRL